MAAGLAPSGSGRWPGQGQSPLLLRCQTPIAAAAPPALSGTSGTHWYRISPSMETASVWGTKTQMRVCSAQRSVASREEAREGLLQEQLVKAKLPQVPEAAQTVTDVFRIGCHSWKRLLEKENAGRPHPQLLCNLKPMI